MRSKTRTGFYHSLVTIPDRLYPFKTYVAGEWVRGLRSYDVTLERYQRKYGKGAYGFKLDAYRQIFHLVGSLLYLVCAAYLSEHFLGGARALYFFLGAAVFLVSFQEFYLHRRLYEQLWKKSFIDWLAWCVPMGMYFFSHFH